MVNVQPKQEKKIKILIKLKIQFKYCKMHKSYVLKMVKNNNLKKK